jgi:hypothetical protein
MARYLESENRQQTQLLPDCLEDYVSEDNPVRVVDVFIDELDLGGRDGAAGLSSRYPPQAVPLRLPQPDSAEPPARAGLRLRCSERHLSMPCRRDAHMALLVGRERYDALHLLD